MIKFRLRSKKQSPVTQADGLRPRRPRVPVSFEVRCELDSAVVSTADASNLSDTGICININDPVSIKDNLVLEFHIPNESGAIKAVGQVTWCRLRQKEDGRQTLSFTAGIKFLEIDASNRKLIRGFVSDLRKDEKLTKERDVDPVPQETPVSKEEKRADRMSAYIYERRNGKDRRSGTDRRSGFDRRGRRQRLADEDRRKGMDRRQTSAELTTPS
jgi:hypothetical protein